MKVMTIRSWFLCVVLSTTLMMTACNSSASNVNNNSTLTPTPIASSSVLTTPNSRQTKLPRLEGKATVLMIVKGSPITLEIDGTNAPITAGNFVDLVQKGVYDGLAFHRVVRQPQPFVVQGGDPQSKNSSIPMGQLGTGGFIDPNTGSERRIPLEIKAKDGKEPNYSQTFEEAGIKTPPLLKHTRGAVAMARSMNPDSASSQFYITLADLPFLDGSYAVFGYVKEGMDGVDKIQQGDRIDSAKVITGVENLKY